MDSKFLKTQSAIDYGYMDELIDYVEALEKIEKAAREWDKFQGPPARASSAYTLHMAIRNSLADYDRIKEAK